MKIAYSIVYKTKSMDMDNMLKGAGVSGVETDSAGVATHGYSGCKNLVQLCNKITQSGEATQYDITVPTSHWRPKELWYEWNRYSVERFV